MSIGARMNISINGLPIAIVADDPATDPAARLAKQANANTLAQVSNPQGPVTERAAAATATSESVSIRASTGQSSAANALTRQQAIALYRELAALL